MSEKQYIVVGQNRWSRVAGLEAAKARFKAEGGSLGLPHVIFEFEPGQEAWVSSMDGSVEWKGAPPRVVADRRSTADREAYPLSFVDAEGQHLFDS